MGDNDTSKKKREPVGCKILGAAIEEIREQRDQTVAEFLHGTGFAPSSYYRWRDGDSMPTAGNLRRLFQARPLAPEEWDRLTAALVAAPAGGFALGERPRRSVELPGGDDAGLAGLAALFRVARARRGASVDEMAAAACMGRSSWRKWSSGIALPVPSLSRAWARAVKLSPMERAEFGQALAAVYFGPASVSVEGDCDGLDVPRVDARTVDGADCDGGGERC